MHPDANALWLRVDETEIRFLVDACSYVTAQFNARSDSLAFKLPPSSAVLFIGCTPAGVRYFSFPVALADGPEARLRVKSDPQPNRQGRAARSRWPGSGRTPSQPGRRGYVHILPGSWRFSLNGRGALAGGLGTSEAGVLRGPSIAPDTTAVSPNAAPTPHCRQSHQIRSVAGGRMT